MLDVLVLLHIVEEEERRVLAFGIRCYHSQLRLVAIKSKLTAA